MKGKFLLILCCLATINTLGGHISGGEIFYRYLGPGAGNTNKYEITLRLFRDCSASGANTAAMPPSAYISIFDNSNDIRISDNFIPRNVGLDERIEKTDYSCLDTKPEVCYDVGYYRFEIDLPKNAKGYTVSFQTCCRPVLIDNLVDNFGSMNGAQGVTYAARISGTDELGASGVNSGPQFKLKDTALVCAANFFTLDFGATDGDGDSLSYSFCPAYGSDPTVLNAASTPGGGPTNGDFPFLNYRTGFSGSEPMGSGVTIDPVTGIISGIAPATPGRFVINVCITEWRNGKPIGRHRKDFNVKTASCNPVKADLLPEYRECDTYTLSFNNATPNPAGTTYFWDFGDPKSGAQNTSTLATPTHTYSDTGIYKLKLTVTLSGQCVHTDSAIVRVYPGFFPAFISTGQCQKTVISFNDRTQTAFGTVNSWLWNFGDPTSTTNTSNQKNPVHTFAAAGAYNIALTVTNSKGCIKTITQAVDIKANPALAVTNDTLICSIDTLQLNAVGTGTFSWTPNYNISNQNGPSPLVSPDVPTKYYVTLTDAIGCISTDSVFVDVKLFVSLDLGSDTGVCAGDAIRLEPISDALNYRWSPAAHLDNANIKNPNATPTTTTKFYVIGNIGKCQATDSITIRVAPYPGTAGIPDTVLCFGNNVQLNASGGSTYTWSPPFFLNDVNIPNPVASPDKSIKYVVTITDTLGCPKPSFDTVVVQVQRVIADAGPRDTFIVVNQPLQLNGTGGQFYLWTPSTGLNNSTIYNPVATLNNDMDYVLTVSTPAGCSATDTISIKVFKVVPGIYVPTGFTPNRDGRNDVFRPIIIGMKQINYFKVFNRWGVLMYSSNRTVYEEGSGWDGTFKGKPQDSDVFVWIAEGIDYLDKKITKKGTVTLIR